MVVMVTLLVQFAKVRLIIFRDEPGALLLMSQ